MRLWRPATVSFGPATVSYGEKNTICHSVRPLHSCTFLPLVNKREQDCPRTGHARRRPSLLDSLARTGFQQHWSGTTDSEVSATSFLGNSAHANCGRGHSTSLRCLPPFSGRGTAAPRMSQFQSFSDESGHTVSLSPRIQSQCRHTVQSPVTISTS